MEPQKYTYNLATATSRSDWLDCNHCTSTCSCPVPRNDNRNFWLHMSAFPVPSCSALHQWLPCIQWCLQVDFSALILHRRIVILVPVFSVSQLIFARDSALKKHTDFLRNAGKECPQGNTMTSQFPSLYWCIFIGPHSTYLLRAFYLPLECVL